MRVYAKPGGWTGGLGYYRAIFESMKQNRETAVTKLTMPILAIGGESALGIRMEESLRGAAANPRGVVIADCGHYVAEEQPSALLKVLMPFLTEA